MKTTALENLEKIFQSYENIYEVAVIISKRARKIQDERKEAFEGELDSIGVSGHPNEVPMNKDNWQEAVYKKYEKKDKPTVTAITDLATGKISHRYMEHE